MAHQRTSSVSSHRSSNGGVLTPSPTPAPVRRTSSSGSSSAIVLASQASRRTSLTSSGEGSTYLMPDNMLNLPYTEGRTKQHSNRNRRSDGRARESRKVPTIPRYLLRSPFRHNEELLRSVLPTGQGLGQPLTTQEKHVLYELRQAAKKFRVNNKRIPIILFTDIGKDRDDILALMALSVLHRAGVFELMLVVVNIYPVSLRAAFTRGLLDTLGLYHVPVAVGSDKPLENVNNVKYYYEDKYERMPNSGFQYPLASRAVPEVLRALEAARRKARIITIGSLRDVSNIADHAEDLFKRVVEQVHAQGGHKWITKESLNRWMIATKQTLPGKMPSLPSVPSVPHKSGQYTELVPSEDATNNMNDWKAATNWHKFLQGSRMPFASYTKISTFSSPPPQSIFDDLPRNELALTRYLRYLNVEQSWTFYWCTLYESRRIRPTFDEIFYFANLTTWPRKVVEENGKKVLYWMQEDGNEDQSTWKKTPPRLIKEATRPDDFPPNKYEPCKPAPPSFMKFFAPIMKMTAYDVIAVCGAAGPEVANILGVCSPKPSQLPDHAGIVGEKFASQEDDRPTRFAKTGTDNITHPIALSALLKQALINCPKQR